MEQSHLPAPPTLSAQRELLDRLTQMAARCAAEELEFREQRVSGVAAARAEFAEQCGGARLEFEAEHARHIAASGEARESILREYERLGTALAKEEEEFHSEETRQLAEFMNQVQSGWELRRQKIESKSEDRRKSLERELEQFRQECAGREREIQSFVVEAQKVVRRRCAWPGDSAAAPRLATGLTRQQCFEQSAAALARAGEWLYALEHERASRFLEDGWPVLIFLFAALAGGYPAWLLLGSWGWYWAVGGCFVAALVLALGVRQIMRPIARSRTLKLVPQFQAAVGLARAHLAASSEAGARGAERARAHCRAPSGEARRRHSAGRASAGRAGVVA